LRGWRAQFELGDRNFCFPVKKRRWPLWQACVRMAPSSGAVPPERAPRAPQVCLPSITQTYVLVGTCVRVFLHGAHERLSTYIPLHSYVRMSCLLCCPCGLRPACWAPAPPGRPSMMNARQARLQACVPQARMPRPHAAQLGPALAPTHRHRPRARSEALRERALAARFRWVGGTARPVCAGVGDRAEVHQQAPVKHARCAGCRSSLFVPWPTLAGVLRGSACMPCPVECFAATLTAAFVPMGLHIPAAR